MENSFSIILIGTENSGNIGAVARIMKNFGCRELILINPLAQPNNRAAQGFAMHADDVLSNATILQFEKKSYLTDLRAFLEQYLAVIGTSAQGIAFKNINRIPVYLPEFDFTQFPESARVALVFGRESTGLTNGELGCVDFILRIPTGKVYPTLNLSHAVGVILYHIFTQSSEITREQVLLADSQTKHDLAEIFSEVVAKTPLADHRHARTSQAFQNVIGRALLSQKEFEYLRNLFRKILLVYDRPELQRNPSLQKDSDIEDIEDVEDVENVEVVKDAKDVEDVKDVVDNKGTNF
ncbi:MAG: RNA methyltransferase [Promethearchaeota archaeon]